MSASKLIVWDVLGSVWDITCYKNVFSFVHED